MIPSIPLFLALMAWQVPGPESIEHGNSLELSIGIELPEVSDGKSPIDLPSGLDVLVRSRDGSVRVQRRPIVEGESGLELRSSWPCQATRDDFVIVVFGDNLTSPPLPVGPVACSSAVQVSTRLRPAARLAGKIDVADSAAPRSALLFPEPCEELPNRRPFVFFDPYPIQIGPSGEFAAALPHGCHRLRLEARGFELRQLGSITMTAEGADVGQIPLSSSQSVLRILVTDDTGVPVPNAVVQIHSQASPRGAVTRAFRGQWTEPAVGAWKAGSDGWLELTTLPEGDFFAGFFSADQEFAFNFEGPWTFGSDTVKEVESHLPGWSSLTVSVDADPEQLAASGSPAVSIVPAWLGTWITGAMQQILIDPWVPVASIEKLPATTYLVSLDAGEDRGRRYEVTSTEVTLATGESRFVALELATARAFRGRVVSGSEPLADATLQFRSASPDTQQGLVARSDDQGYFRILGAAGTYRVDVQHLAGEFLTVVDGVRLVDPAEEVLIELPTASVSGRVVDVDGAPKSGVTIAATITLDPAKNQSNRFDPLRVFQTGTRTDRRGRFELAALPEGVWEVHAELAGLKSDTEVVDLQTGGQEDVVLTLRESVKLRAKLLTPDGRPVPDVFIGAWWLDAQARVPGSRLVKSGPLGEFELEFRSGQQGLIHLDFRKAGLPFTVDTLRLDGTSTDREIHLPTRGGALRLSGVEPGRSQRWLLRHRGSGAFAVSGPPLVPAAGDGSAGVEVIPSLAAGTWEILAPRSMEEAFGLLSASSVVVQGIPKIATFTIEPGSTTEIDLK